jgi:hypothetical protein
MLGLRALQWARGLACQPTLKRISVFNRSSTDSMTPSATLLIWCQTNLDCQTHSCEQQRLSFFRPLLT